MKILYYERTFIDDYRCIDEVKQIKAVKVYRSGDLFYADLGNFNTKVIELSRIIQITSD